MALKKKQVVELYTALKDAKAAKIPASKRLNLAKLLLEVKKVNTEFDETRENLIKQASSDDHDKMVQDVQQYNREQQAGKVESFTDERIKELDAYFSKWNQEIDTGIKQWNAEDYELQSSKLDEETWNGLVDSNPDWSLETLSNLLEIKE